jgi:hypothetical protein
MANTVHQTFGLNKPLRHKHRNVGKIIANTDINLKVAPKLQNCHLCKINF